MKSKKVLIVEPSESIAGRLAGIVERINFEPQVALSKEHAASVLNTDDIGIILLSENLPGAPHIALTAHTQEVPFAVIHYLPMDDESKARFEKYNPITYIPKEDYKEIAQGILANHIVE